MSLGVPSGADIILREELISLSARCLAASQLGSNSEAAVKEWRPDARQIVDVCMSRFADWLREHAAAGDLAMASAVKGSTLERDLAAGVVTLNRAADKLWPATPA